MRFGEIHPQTGETDGAWITVSITGTTEEGRKHSSMDKWIDFYESFFPTRADAQAFVEALEALDADAPRHRAKIMMHQAQRLVSLADDLAQIRPGKESLQLLFLIICAENIAKLFHNFDDEGQSRAYVRRFFDEFVIGNDRDTLERSFVAEDFVALNLQQVVDTLYSVRCDVVHEGQYWGFQFHDGKTRMITGDPVVTVSLQLTALRDIVVRGCIRAINEYAAP